MAEHELIAHWPLDGDARDVGGRHHGDARNVAFGEGPRAGRGAALFNGRDSLIEVPDAEELRLGNADFTIGIWVKCEVPMRSVFGDVVGKFDPYNRCGLNLHISGSSSAYCSTCDTRHVHFGIDDGYTGPWEDHGQPWATNTLVPVMVVFDGQLYAGLADAEDPMDAAKVFRYAGGREWIDCGRLGDDPNHLSVQSLCVHDGKLYAGTGIWDWHRASGNDPHGRPCAPTRVFVYEGGTEWRDLGAVGGSARLFTLASFEGDLYAGLCRVGGGHVWKYDGAAWSDCGSPDGDNIECLLPVAGTLYAATHKNYYRYQGGQTWQCFSREPHGINQTHALQVYGGKVYSGTWPQGYVLRLEDDDRWTNTGRLGLPDGMMEINEINDLTVYNGKLYAGVIPKAQVYRYEVDGVWTPMPRLASMSGWAERDQPTWGRVPAMAAFQGKLFAASGACRARTIDMDPDRTFGRVYAFQAGQVVSHERDIGGEWTHLAAVRRGKELRLYVDGELSACSTAPPGQTFDLANTKPLSIGFGAQTYFAGALSDLRVYAASLDAEAIRAIHAL